MAMVEIARWWRQKQRSDPQVSSRLLSPCVLQAKPRTQLVQVSRTRECVSWMRKRIAELEEEIAASSRKPSLTDLLGLLGSFQFLCGDLTEAKLSYTRAVSLEEKALGGGLGGRKFAAALARVTRQIEADQTVASVRPSSEVFSEEPLVLQNIERRDGTKLGYIEFMSEYADKGVPVILTGLFEAGMFVRGAWSFDRLQEELGNKLIVPRRRVEDSPDWAHLEDSQQTSLSEFLEKISASSCEDYIFDWNLPGNAPDLVDELRIPKFFSGDLLQHLPEGSLYREAWPSLFIGPKGSRSGLHIDAFGR
mmetsp:Transcript_46767/g.146643  ORF Transcript_46767/g.146643 Transcript_46767/m.146643 type:complete len:307 (-) Transcript_46767:521-1441(-)